MSWTKLQLCAESLNQIGFGTYLYDATPDQLNSILWQLDAMMGNWNANGIMLGYPLYTNPSDSHIEQDSNLPVTAISAVYLSLAVQISPSFGKTVAPELSKNQRLAYSAMLAKLSVIPNKQFPNTLPSGIGNKHSNWGAVGNVYIIP